MACSLEAQDTKSVEAQRLVPLLQAQRNAVPYYSCMSLRFNMSVVCVPKSSPAIESSTIDDKHIHVKPQYRKKTEG